MTFIGGGVEMPKRVKAVKFSCDICSDEHSEIVDVEKLMEWVKKSEAPIFMCPKCGEEGLSHINNIHVKVLSKYVDILNSILEAINVEQEKLARHGVWVDLIFED